MSRLSKEAERRQAARQAVNSLVRNGTIPHPRDSFCFDCRGPAAQYDHHRGYDGDAALDVQPVCVPCHVKRGAARGEKRGRPRGGSAPAVELPSHLADRSVPNVRRETAFMIRRGMARAGVGASELARRLGVSPASVSHWIHGSTYPRVDRLLEICCALGLPVKEFFLSSEELAELNRVVA